MNEDNLRIHYCEIHEFTPIKFNTNLRYEQLCEKILNSPLTLQPEHEKKINDKIFSGSLPLIDSLNQIQESMNFPLEFRFRDSEGKIISKEKLHKHMIENQHPLPPLDDILIEVGHDYLGIKSQELTILYNRFVTFANEDAFASKIYSEAYSSSVTRILLLPFKVKLINGIIDWILPILYIFQNNMGMLKLEIPLIDVTNEYIKNIDHDQYVKEFINTWNLDSLEYELCLENLKNIYISNLCRINKISILKESSLNNIILVDYEHQPKNLNTISKEVSEELYKMVKAPLPTLQKSSYSREAVEYIDNNSWGDHNLKYITKKTGGILSIYSSDVTDFILSQKKDEYDIEELEEYEYKNIYKEISLQAHINSEFAIINILLEKLINESNYFEKTIPGNTLNKLKTEYYQNLLFLLSFQQNCHYGSALEQLESLRQGMPYYLKSDITKKRLEAIDNILEIDYESKLDGLQNIFGIFGIIFAILFGLPTINETFHLIYNNFKTDDTFIKFVPLFSIFIWIVLLFKLICYVCKNSSSKYNNMNN